MTLQETLMTKLTQLDAAYATEKAKLESDLKALESSGWLAQDVEAIRTWFAAVAKHL